jgi:hypothetical protein
MPNSTKLFIRLCYETLICNESEMQEHSQCIVRVKHKEERVIHLFAHYLGELSSIMSFNQRRNINKSAVNINIFRLCMQDQKCCL